MSAELTPTTTQLRVLESYARLGSQKAVAHEMGIALQTVKNHMGTLYARLDVGGAVEALSALGWISGPDMSGRPPCGWVAYCGRPEGHRGQHGGFRALFRRAVA